METWKLHVIPIVKLQCNGLKVANFSSPHSFTFTTGEVLGGCADERSRALMLEAEEIETSNMGSVFKSDAAFKVYCEWAHAGGVMPDCCDVPDRSWTDIELKFSMSADVMSALERVCELDVDVVLVPYPVLQCIREIASKSDDGWYLVTSKCRTIRSADRVKKTIYPDRFCK